MENVIQLDKRENIVVPWAGTKEDFLLSINHSEWVITEDNELFYLVNGDSENLKIKETFLIVERAQHHTTDWVRLYFQEHHPEIDFDKEFETDQPGVFARVQEKVGRKYEDFVNNEIYNRLKNELTKLGYKLHWS